MTQFTPTLTDACNQALELGHGVLGEIHIVIAIARGDGPAAEALRRASLDIGALTALASRMYGPPVREQGLLTSPASLALAGRAEGLAVGFGEVSPGPAHYLLAYLWDPHSADILEHAGTSRRAIVAELEKLEVHMPAVELPAEDSGDGGPVGRAEFPVQDLGRVLAELPARLPPGTRWGFNMDYERGRAWVVARGVLDLGDIVAEIRHPDYFKKPS